MAAGDFTLKVTLNGTSDDGTSYDFTGTETYSGVTDAVSQEISLAAATEVSILKIAASAANGTLTDLKALAIINLGDADYVEIGVKSTTKEFYSKLKFGGMIVLDDKEMDANITGAGSGTLVNIDDITAQAITSASKIKILAIK